MVMRPEQIFYIGPLGIHTTSLQRVNAMRRLGLQVKTLDPYAMLARSSVHRLLGAVHYRSGYRLLQPLMRALLAEQAAEIRRSAAVWIESGELFGATCIQQIQSYGGRVILFNHDDPTGGRDGRHFDLVRQAMPFYDVAIAVRQESESEYQALGARCVLRTWRSYDEVAHRPFDDVGEIPETYRSDVAFVGTWIPGEGRDVLACELLDRGIALAIWGERWDRSPLWARLKASSWRGTGLFGRDYVAAMQGAKVCLGLLSKGNRDLHTTRSLEIPYAGGLFCAQRTRDHITLYKEGEEAVFWDNLDECVRQIQWLLDEPLVADRIRIAGMKRVRAWGVGNENLTLKAFEALGLSVKKTVLSG